MSLAADRRLADILEKRTLAGAFFLHGDATRLRDEAARRLAAEAVDPATRDFNFDAFHGSEVDPEALASALAMPPVMAERRVVLLMGAEKLTPTGRKVVLGVLSQLPEDVTLIVTASIPDRSRAAFYRTLKAGATCLEWKAPREDEIPGWLMERARSRFDADVSREAATALSAAVGADLSLLDGELEKLADAAEGTIDLDLVRELVANVREVDRWAWIDGVLSREYEAARRSLPVLLSAPGESAVGLLIPLVEQHLLVGVALEGGARLLGRTLDRIGKPYLKWKTRALAEQARHWTVADVEEALIALAEADRRAKTGGSDRQTLEELLLRLEVQRRRAGSSRMVS